MDKQMMRGIVYTGLVAGIAIGAFVWGGSGNLCYGIATGVAILFFDLVLMAIGNEIAKAIKGAK